MDVDVDADVDLGVGIDVAIGTGVCAGVDVGAGVYVFFDVFGCLPLLRSLEILIYTFVVFLPKVKSFVGFSSS